jgi:hypothetical protein
MLAMNQLKDFAIEQNPPLNRAFRWKTSTLPPRYKKGSISYYQVGFMLIALACSCVGN